MNRNKLSNLTAGAQRRKGQGPTTYKPPRNDPSILNPPTVPKPWNYSPIGGGKSGQTVQSGTSYKSHGTTPGTATASDKSRGVTGLAGPKVTVPKLDQPLSQSQSKPEWDPFFWKNEAQLNNKKRGVSNLEIDGGIGDLFQNYPKFLDLIAEEASSDKVSSLSSPSVQKKVTGGQLPPAAKSVTNVTVTVEDTQNHKSDDTGKPSRANYHKWWSTVLGDLPMTATNPVANENENPRPAQGLGSESSKSSNIPPKPPSLAPSTAIPIQSVVQSPKPSPVVVAEEGETPLDNDNFLLELADVSELVEFLLYKCAAEECLPMLPEVLQDLDGHFHALVTKYQESKKVERADSTCGGATAGSGSVDLSLLKEISTLHKDLERKNGAILKTNECLLVEVENLKGKLLGLQEFVRNQEVVEGQLRGEIRELKRGTAIREDGQEVDRGKMATDEAKATTTFSQPITIDLIQLKVENEALKLMNTKLRHETELNNRILGIMELNHLCHTYQQCQEGSRNLGEQEAILGDVNGNENDKNGNSLAGAGR